MRTTDQNHLKQQRLPNGRFAPRTPTVPPTSQSAANLLTTINASPDTTVPVTKLVASGQNVAPLTEPLVNHIALVIDQSGSMGHLRDEVPKRFAELVRTIRHNANVTGQKTTLTLVRLGVATVWDNNQVHMDYFCKDINSVDEHIRYSPSGGTPLLDAVGLAVTSLRDRTASDKKNVSFLVVTITDGEENQSRNYNSITFRNLLNTVQSTDRWTFTFSLPPGKKTVFCNNFGIPVGNCQEWEATTRGLEVASHTTQQGVTHYYTARSTGSTNTTNFYTNLSGLTLNRIASNLQDIQSKCRVLKVEKETEIRSFVEEKTGKPYSLGTAFYQLTKPETVQAGKQLLVKEKTSNAIYGGHDARDVLGMPRGVELKVIPGNHSNYDVYVQSTSTNRKLVRGSTLIVMT